jgi:hypothetical protein
MTEDPNDRHLETALRNLPLDETPAGFAEELRTRLGSQPTRAPRRPPRRWLAATGIGIAAAALGGAGVGVGFASNTATPQIATITCGDALTSVDQARVDVQPDGVHVLVQNRTDVPVTVQLQNGTAAFATPPIPPGSLAVSVPVPPGPTTVRCVASQGDRTYGESQTLTTEDPSSNWVTANLACGVTSNQTAPDMEQSQVGTPEAVARSYLDPQPGDVMQTAGYSAGSARTIALIRGDVAVALVKLHAATDGGWNLVSISRC